MVYTVYMSEMKEDNEDTKAVHIRALPTWIWEELEKAGKEEFRSASAQLVFILAEWARGRRQP
jgi:hypothetical protein